MTITGTNDGPTIISDAAHHEGGVKEDVGVNSGDLVAHDTITFQDLDLIDTHTATVAFTSSTSSDPLPGFDDNTSLGSFTIDSSVTEVNSDTDNTGTLGWKFTVDNSNPIVQSLAEGQTITQIYTITIDDQHTGGTVEQEVTVTITGTNDGPAIISDAAHHEGGVKEMSEPTTRAIWWRTTRSPSRISI